MADSEGVDADRRRLLGVPRCSAWHTPRQSRALIDTPSQFHEEGGEASRSPLVYPPLLALPCAVTFFAQTDIVSQEHVAER